MSNPFITASSNLDFIAQRGSRDANIVTVAEALLQFCRGCESEFQAAISDFNQRRAKSRIRGFFRLVFTEARREERTGPLIGRRKLEWMQAFLNAPTLASFATAATGLSATALAWLQRLDHGQPLGWWPMGLTPIVKARAMAQAVDDVYSDMFFIGFKELHRNQHSVRLKPGMAFPSSPSKMQVRRSAYRVATTDDFLSHLPHLRIFPVNAPLQVEVLFDDPTTEEILNSLGIDQTRLQAGIVCLGPVDFGPQHEHFSVQEGSDVHVYEPGECHPEEVPSNGDNTLAGIGTFFHVSMKDTFFSVKDAMKLIQTADEEGVRTILMPELTFDMPRMLMLRDRFLAGPWQSVRSLVAGSVHMTLDDATKRNRLFVFTYAPDDPRPALDPETGLLAGFVHDKLGWFGARNLAKSRVPRRTSANRVLHLFDYEDVARTGVLKVLLAGVHLVGFTICKDVICRSVNEIIDKIGISYLYAVSLSPRTNEFLVRFASHTTLNNTISLMAATTSSGEATAVVSVPVEATLVAVQNALPRSNPRRQTLRPFFTLKRGRVRRKRLVKVLIDNDEAGRVECRVL